MTNPSFQSRLRRIVELNERRTPSPWIYEHNEMSGNLDLWFGSSIQERETGMHDASGYISVSDCNYNECDGDRDQIANAAFIAAAPETFQLLLEAVEAVGVLRSALKRQNDYGFHMAAWDHEIVNKALKSTEGMSND